MAVQELRVGLKSEFATAMAAELAWATGFRFRLEESGDHTDLPL